MTIDSIAFLLEHDRGVASVYAAGHACIKEKKGIGLLNNKTRIIR